MLNNPTRACSQRDWRCRRARASFAATRQAALRVQAIWRGRNARAMFGQMQTLHAASVLQVRVLRVM